MPSAIEVRKVPIHSVADASELARLIDDGVMAADRVIAIIGKTEGNGGVNDYTRIISDRAFREVLVAKGAPADQVKQVPIVWSGGTDGVISPHATIFATTDAEPSDEPRLTVGFAMSEVLQPEDIGRVAMVSKVADAVKVAMERAGITDVADVHYVQTKTPLLTVHTIRDAKSRGKTVWTEHTHESMDLSNGCTALGIAVALGEIEMPGDADVMHNRDLFSSVASCSSGVELDQAQVVVVGNATGVGGRYRVGHSVMKDALDADGIWDAIRSAGLDLPERPHTSDLERPARQRVPQVRGVPGRPGPGPAQRDARRLRRALAPADQGGRRRRHRRGHRRPGGVRLGVRGPPGPRRGRPGGRDRRPRLSRRARRVASGGPVVEGVEVQPPDRGHLAGERACGPRRGVDGVEHGDVDDAGGDEHPARAPSARRRCGSRSARPAPPPAWPCGRRPS